VAVRLPQELLLALLVEHLSVVLGPFLPPLLGLGPV
jgi:hypothetical protein